MQQHARLVGPEPVTRQPVGEAGRLETRDSNLLSPRTTSPSKTAVGSSLCVVTTKLVLVPLGYASAFLTTRRSGDQLPTSYIASLSSRALWRASLADLVIVGD